MLTKKKYLIDLAVIMISLQLFVFSLIARVKSFVG